jgi:hypothetical protein
MDICCECCVLSGRLLCYELITRPEEAYRVCCVVVCDLKTSWMRGPWPTGGGAVAPKTNKQTNPSATLRFKFRLLPGLESFLGSFTWIS